MDSNLISRRRLLGHGCAWACAWQSSSIRCALASGAPAAVDLPLKEFRHGSVQLGAGPLLTQFEQQHRLFLNIDDDMLLKPFRVRAGQDAPVADMGGWYDQSSDFHIDPKNWSTQEWLTAARRAPDEWVVAGKHADIKLRPFMAIADQTYRLYSRLRA